MRVISQLAATALLALFFQGCFTGVESTPRIGNSELRRQNASAPSAEKLYLADVATDPLPNWRRGKEFMVEDAKVALNFGTSSTGIDFTPGDVIEYIETLPAVSPMGEATDLVFSKKGSSQRLVYRINASAQELAEREVVELPFTVDLDISMRLRDRLVGNTYYILTPRWLDATLKNTTRRKFIPVKVTGVYAGNSDFPVRVQFEVEEKSGRNATYSVYMTVGDGRRATRNFESLFSLTDPREKYSTIQDEVWNAIVEGRLVKHMTRDEVRLSLGSPKDIIRGHDYSSTYERWEYDGGVYLIFRDGLLEEFRR